MTAPYYEDWTTTLYLGSCMDELNWDVYGEVLITDPPYGISYKSRKGQTIANDEDTSLRDLVLALWREPQPERPWCAFGTWLKPRPAGTKQMLIWDKGNSPGMGNTALAFGLTHEEIYLGGAPFLRSEAFKRRCGVIRTEGMGWLPRQTGHPTPKPDAIMDVLIAAAPPGIIVDPFAGSGSTLVAAAKAGRISIGVEMEERHCETIAKRLSALREGVPA